MSQLPPGWYVTTVGEIADISSGFGFPKHLQGKTAGRYPFAKVRDISNAVRTQHGQLSQAENYVDDNDLAILRAKPVPAGSTVFAKIGEALKLNRRAIARTDLILDNNCIAISPRLGIEPEFVFQYMKTVDLGPMSIATTVPSVRRGDIEAIPVALPPQQEQRRIVAKLDSLRTRSAHARSELDHIQKLIERYKQAILAKALCGETTNLTPLVELIDEGPTNGYSPKASTDGQGTLSLKLTATTRGVLDLSERAVKRLGETVSANSRLWLEPGDLLIQRANSLEYLGAAAIYEGPRQTYIYPDLMMRVRIGCPHLRRFVWRYLNGPIARSYFQSKATGTAGNMPKINGSTVRNLMIPVPAPDGIKRINEKIDQAMAWLEKIATEHQQAAHLLPKLDQAILAKAFRGDLVPQDPNDQPAAAQLAQIRMP